MPQGVQLHLGQRHLPVKSAARPKTCSSSSGAGQGAGAGWSQTKGVIKDCVADAGGRLGTSRAPAGTRFVLGDLMERRRRLQKPRCQARLFDFSSAPLNFFFFFPNFLGVKNPSETLEETMKYLFGGAGICYYFPFWCCLHHAGADNPARINHPVMDK